MARKIESEKEQNINNGNERANTVVSIINKQIKQDNQCQGWDKVNNSTVIFKK